MNCYLNRSEALESILPQGELASANWRWLFRAQVRFCGIAFVVHMATAEERDLVEDVSWNHSSAR